MRKPSLLEGCKDWHVATDLKKLHISNWNSVNDKLSFGSLKQKKVFVIELTVPFEENFEWGHISVSWKNMKICENNVSEMAG